MPQTAPSPSEIGLRPFLPADLPFLQALYDSTRVREMALIPWPERQKQAFLRQQLTARETHYAAAHPQGAHDVVIVEGCDAGRLLVDSTPVEVLVVDIALLPQHRGRGVGTRLLHQVLVQAGDRPVRLHVDPENVARRLYVRLGFTSVRVEGFHELMERLP